MINYLKKPLGTFNLLIRLPPVARQKADLAQSLQISKFLLVNHVKASVVFQNEHGYSFLADKSSAVDKFSHGEGGRTRLSTSAPFIPQCVEG
jgi:hypothetical protein